MLTVAELPEDVIHPIVNSLTLQEAASFGATTRRLWGIVERHLRWELDVRLQLQVRKLGFGCSNEHGVTDVLRTVHTLFMGSIPEALNSQQLGEITASKDSYKVNWFLSDRISDVEDDSHSGLVSQFETAVGSPDGFRGRCGRIKLLLLAPKSWEVGNKPKDASKWSSIRITRGLWNEVSLQATVSNSPTVKLLTLIMTIVYPRLRSLSLDRSRLSFVSDVNRDWGRLLDLMRSAEAPTLRSLQFSGVGTCKTWSTIPEIVASNMRSVQTLDLRDQMVNWETFTYILSHLPSLRNLRVKLKFGNNHHQKDINSAIGTAACGNLRQLDIGNSDITSRHLAAIVGTAPGLRRLSVRSCRRLDSIACLSRLRRLGRLSLDQCPRVPAHQILALLEDIPRLQLEHQVQRTPSSAMAG